MSHLESAIEQIKSKPETTEFKAVIDIIDQYYDYTATQFQNGPNDDCTISKAGENEGSCKIFAFAQLHQLNKNQTLNCFGRYYRDDVLEHPNNTDHANIRSFMKYGWENISFENDVLKELKQ